MEARGDVPLVSPGDLVRIRDRALQIVLPLRREHLFERLDLRILRRRYRRARGRGERTRVLRETGERRRRDDVPRLVRARPMPSALRRARRGLPLLEAIRLEARRAHAVEHGLARRAARLEKLREDLVID